MGCGGRLVHPGLSGLDVSLLQRATRGIRHRSRGAPSRPSYAATEANKQRTEPDRRQTAPAVGPDAVTISARIRKPAFPGQDAPRQRRIADPGPSRTRSSRRSRVCSASFHAALRPGNKQKTGKRNADKRCATTSAPPPPSSPARERMKEGARHRPRGGGSPVGVPPRHLRQRPNATAQLQPRDFRGLGRRARPDGSKDARVATLVARTVRTARVTAGVTRAFLSPSSEIAPADRS
jgi:hypothetical protein